METVFIPTENEFKRWVKEVVNECFNEYLAQTATKGKEEQNLLNRQEIAQLLRISLVTLTDWMKRGLPSHQQGRRIYFDKKEVLEYIKNKKSRQFKIGSKLHHLNSNIEFL